MPDTSQTYETRDLISSDRVEGTAVYNPQGERLGTISRFMVDKRSGKAQYAVLQFGGLFGLGSDDYPLPWEILTYDTAQDGYVVDVSKEQLENAPHYPETETPAYDYDYNQRVYSHYGLTYA